MHSTHFQVSLRDTLTPTLRRTARPTASFCPRQAAGSVLRGAGTVARHVLYAPQVLLALPLLLLVGDGKNQR